MVYPGMPYDPYYPTQMRHPSTEEVIHAMEEELEDLEDEKGT